MTTGSSQAERVVVYGCLAFIAGPVVLAALFAFWPLLVVAAVVGAAALMFRASGRGAKRDKVNKIAQDCRGKPLAIHGKHGIARELKVDGSTVVLSAEMLEASEAGPGLVSCTYTLGTIDDRAGLRYSKLFGANGIEWFDPFSLESKAMESAERCWKEMVWCNECLARLKTISEGVDYALSVADDNPLLNPSIERIEDIREKTTQNMSVVRRSLQELGENLADIHEYLSVPAPIRNSFSGDEFCSFSVPHLKEAKQSFSDLLILNESYQELAEFVGS